ncbi:MULTISPECIES: acyl carrier protein [Dactylosporangium]|nr:MULTISPECIES: acyl carrier protein [Dactylosporangium]UAB94001.1 acyl carrier protein [Dactylosporangium vinaceum]UWZ42412.1 acyl carrier protein [Dactylosporangium matsuzakiense]
MVELRQQVVSSMSDLLVRMLRLDRPVTEASQLEEELGMSSSQGVQLILDLERDLSIMIDVEDLEQEELATVGELADYITAHATPQ